MKGYWIAIYKKIESQENLGDYGKNATKAIVDHGGKPLVRGGNYKVYSGDEYPRTVIWEFPTFDKAIQCHDSLEYQNGWSIAKNTTVRNLQIVEGFNTE